SETSSDDKDETEEFDSSSINTQVQDSKKLHPLVKCKYCLKKFKRRLATHMQKHTNSCINALESAKTIKKPKLQNLNLTQRQNSNFTQDRLSTELLENLYKDVKNNVSHKIDNIQNITI
ncbi:17959_t:CDS:2, partial [Racocetra fulgida]